VEVVVPTPEAARRVPSAGGLFHFFEAARCGCTSRSLARVTLCCGGYAVRRRPWLLLQQRHKPRKPGVDEYALAVFLISPIAGQNYIRGGCSRHRRERGWQQLRDANQHERGGISGVLIQGGNSTELVCAPTVQPIRMQSTLRSDDAAARLRCCGSNKLSIRPRSHRRVYIDAKLTDVTSTIEAKTSARSSRAIERILLFCISLRA
jgi:hypothetical protein